MSFSTDLLEQAEHLASREKKRPKQASLRRAVSTSYYSLFHLLTWECANLVASNASRDALVIIQRWFDHGSMNKACGSFAANKLIGSLEKLAGLTPLPDLQLVARTFRNLQQERHKADYDLASHWTRVIAEQNILSARKAAEAWHRVKKDPQTTIFAHALLDLKRVETERQ